MEGDGRGQAHTLEAVTAGMILLASIVFALQVTAVTPLTASTSSQHIENQEEALARGVLATATANGTLKPAVLYWNTTDKTFYNATFQGAYTTGGPPTGFGRTLNRTFFADPTVEGSAGRGIAFNVNVYYRTGSGIERVQMVNMGQPSDQAAVATRKVTLYDDDHLYGPGADGTEKLDARIGNTSRFYAPDVSEHSGVYNVVVVEVVTWRM